MDLEVQGMKQISVKVDEQTYREIQEVTEVTGQTISAYIRACIVKATEMHLEQIRRYDNFKIIGVKEPLAFCLRCNTRFPVNVVAYKNCRWDGSPVCPQCGAEG